MSYYSKAPPDGLQLPAGTLRTFYTDDRACWGVTLPGDPNFGNALNLWESGEFWDGAEWLPLDAYNDWQARRFRGAPANT